MKIVKYIFLLVLLAAIAVTVFIATQEGKYDINKEQVIKVPKTVLYNYINDYRNWEYVGILTNNDTTAVFSYSDKTAGAGAITTWKAGSREGKVETVKVIENDSIIQKAVIESQPSDIVWGFKETAGGTKVSVRLKGELDFKDKAYAILNGGVNDRLEAILDKGLENLNTFLVHELSTYNVEVKGLVNKTATFYLKQASTATNAELAKKSGAILGKLMAFIKTNKIAVNGAPFILYKNRATQKDTIAFSVCIPIKEEIFTAPGSEFEGGKLEAFKALKTTLKGDYSHLKSAWNTAAKNIRDKSLPENIDGNYIEVYTKNIQHTKKPSGWITDIYIPVGPRTGPPEVPVDILALPPATGTIQPAGAAPATNRPNTRPAVTPTAVKPATANTSKPASTQATPARTTAPAHKPAATAPVTPKPKPKPAAPTTTTTSAQ